MRVNGLIRLRCHKNIFRFAAVIIVIRRNIKNNRVGQKSPITYYVTGTDPSPSYCIGKKQVPWRRRYRLPSTQIHISIEIVCYSFNRCTIGLVTTVWTYVCWSFVTERKFIPEHCTGQCICFSYTEIRLFEVIYKRSLVVT